MLVGGLVHLEFVISVPENSGEVSERPFSITGKDGVQYLSPNPLVKLVKSKYQIGIRIKDAAVNSRLMDALLKAGLKPNTNEGNFFAFLKTNM